MTKQEDTKEKVLNLQGAETSHQEYRQFEKEATAVYGALYDDRSEVIAIQELSLRAGGD